MEFHFRRRTHFLVDKNSPDFLDNFFNIALQITRTIGDIHQQFIIHKDLNPHNILWDAENKTIKVIDFGIATELSREKQITIPIY